MVEEKLVSEQFGDLWDKIDIEVDGYLSMSLFRLHTFPKGDSAQGFCTSPHWAAKWKLILINFSLHICIQALLMIYMISISILIR